MKPSALVGTLLIAVALLDIVIGLRFVAPRAPESARPVLRAAFVGGACLMVLVGAAFWAGLLDGF